MITDSFDMTSPAAISPAMMAKPCADFPETLVVTFQPKTFRVLLNTFQPSYLTYLELEEDLGRNAPSNVYSFAYKGHRVGAYLSPMGAPSAVTTMEVAIANGAKRFVVFGSCGTLQADLKNQGIIVPTSAYRDEGTSYHYAAPSDYIDLPTSARVAEILTELKVPHTLGKVWTTDGFFRETQRNLADRINEGCIGVDMEASAMAAVAQFRGVDVFHFLYAADSLGDQWDPRDLGTLSHEPRGQFVRIGLEIAIRVSG